MDFETGFRLLTNWEKSSYHAILLQVNWLMKIIYYKPIIILIDAANPTHFIIYILITHHNFFNLIVCD